MLKLSFLPARLWLALATSCVGLLLVGCSKQNGQAPSDSELRAFNGADGKMPDDFKAKMQAAQQNGQATQQQSSQTARQKAAGQPAKR